MNINGEQLPATIPNVLYVPNMSSTLISVTNLTEREHTLYLSCSVPGCVTCHTRHGPVTHFRPILGNVVEVTLVTPPTNVYKFPH